MTQTHAVALAGGDSTVKGDPTDASQRLTDKLRETSMPASVARLYKERAGLDPAEALRWWERHILSGEARDAIAEGLDVEQAAVVMAQRFKRRAAARCRDTEPVERRISRAVRGLRATGTTGIVVRTSDAAVYRVRSGDDRFVVERMEGDPDDRLISFADDMTSAVATLADELRRLHRTVVAIHTRGLPDGSFLASVQPLASVAEANVRVDGRRTTLVAEHLVPVDPSAWPGCACHAGLIESVGMLHFVRDTSGHVVEAGVFPNRSRARRALAAPAAGVALIEVRRTSPTGTSLVTARHRDGAVVVTAADGLETVAGTDVIAAVESVPLLHQVRGDDVTEIALHPVVDADAFTRALRVVCDGDPLDPAELAWPHRRATSHDSVLPPDVRVPAVWIGRQRWAGVEVEGRDGLVLVPIAASAKHLTVGLVTAVLADEWATLDVRDRGEDSTLPARFALGAVTPTIVGDLREAGGDEPRATFTSGDLRSKTSAIASWLSRRAEELDLDVLSLADSVLRGTTRGEVRAVDVSPFNPPSLVCELRCNVSDDEARAVLELLGLL
jgi:hypothetical protein